MSQINSQFANIFIHYYTNKASSTSKLFISEPNLALEDRMGRLFGVLEINTPSRENPHIIAELITALEETYYGEMAGNNQAIEVSFESALDKVNEKFTQLLQEKRFYLVGNLNENTIKEKINLAIGVLHENKLCISYSNEIGIFLFHKTKQDYKVVDLRKINGVDNNNKEPRLFSNFLQGELNPPDYLFLCNSNFCNFFSMERIQKTITSLPIHKAAEYFKNSLLATEGQNFAAVIIKNSLSGFEQSQISPSVISISDLTKTENSTEKLLAPSFWSIIKSLLNTGMVPLQNLYADIQKKIEAKKLAAEQQSLPNFTDGEAIKTRISAKTPLTLLKTKVKKTFRIFLAKTPFYGEKSQKTKLWLRLRWIYIKTQLAKIPTLSKILLGLALVLITVFIFSITYFQHAQNGSTNDPAYQESLNQIEDKKNQAESDLIIGDETKARAEIVEAQNLLAALPVKSQKQKNNYQNINSEIEGVINKLRHIVNIDEPTLLYDLSGQQNIDLKNLVYSNGLLLAFDSTSNSIYSYNTKNNEQKTITSNLANIGKIVKAKNIGGRVIIFHDKNGLIEYKDGKYSDLGVPVQTNAKITDYAFYNNNFYTLDIANDQIYKFPKTDAGFGDGLAWIKDVVDVTNAISMGIDTNVWVLDNKGQILKFNKGAKKSFEIKNLDPIFESPTLLLTSDETNYLYILEPKNSRIVVLGKDGQLVNQYYSQKFDNLKSFDINEKDKKMYLLNGSKIYSIDLTHIK